MTRPSSHWSPVAGEKLIGTALAAAQGWRCDTDARIEEEAGDVHLRHLDTSTPSLSQPGARVIRCLTEGDADINIGQLRGAGAPVWIDNMDKMLACCCVVYLVSRAPLLAKRLDDATRPPAVTEIYGDRKGWNAASSRACAYL
jgi:hypothetical protein